RVCDAVEQARFSRVDLCDRTDPPRRGWGRPPGHVAPPRGADLLARECEPAGVKLYASAANLEHQQPRRIGPQPIGEHLAGPFHEKAAGLLAGSLNRVEGAAGNAPETETQAPTG